MLIGWHLVDKDRKLRYEDKRVVKAGRTYKLKSDKPVYIYKNGFHASDKLEKLYASKEDFRKGMYIC